MKKPELFYSTEGFHIFIRCTGSYQETNLNSSEESGRSTVRIWAPDNWQYAIHDD